MLGRRTGRLPGAAKTAGDAGPGHHPAGAFMTGREYIEAIADELTRLRKGLVPRLFLGRMTSWVESAVSDARFWKATWARASDRLQHRRDCRGACSAGTLHFPN